MVFKERIPMRIKILASLLSVMSVFTLSAMEKSTDGQAEWCVGLPSDMWFEIVIRLQDPLAEKNINEQIQKLACIRNINRFFNNLLSVPVLSKILQSVNYEEHLLNKSLFVVIEKNNAAMIWLQALLQAGANKDAQGEEQKTPLHVAAQRGHTVYVQALLDAGADKDKRYGNYLTLLHVAAQVGHVACVQVLLNAGIDKNAKDNEQWTPLHVAIKGGYVACVQALLDAGAEVNAKANVHVDDWYQITPLHVAAKGGYVACVQALLDAGAEVNARDSYEEMSLHLAATCGHIASVQALLDAGADAYAKNWLKRTPTDIARKLGFIELANMIENYKS